MTVDDLKKWTDLQGPEIHFGFAFQEIESQQIEKWLSRSRKLEEIKKNLRIFGVGPDGSWFAQWNKNEKCKPIVFLGSEGDAFALAEDVPSFLALLTLPYDFSMSGEFENLPSKVELKSLNPEYLGWIKKLKIKTPKNGAEIVSKAKLEHPDFYGWLVDEEQTITKTGKETSKASRAFEVDLSLSEFKKLSKFQQMVYMIGRRVDDEATLEFISSIDAKPLKTANPQDATTATAAEKKGIVEVSASCDLKHRDLWPTKKEGRLYVTYVHKFMLNNKFKDELPLGLKWGQSLEELKNLVLYREVGVLKRPNYYYQINNHSELSLSFDKKNKLESLILILIEEWDLITVGAEYEKEKPLVYVEDAFFATWCAKSGLLDKKKFTDEVIKPLVEKTQTPLEFLNETCGGILWQNDFLPDLFELIKSYFMAFNPDPENFRSDLQQVFGKTNHFRSAKEPMTQDTWENYEKLATVLDRKLKKLILAEKIKSKSK